MAKNLNVTINFDMDGTIANLYGQENWLHDLTHHIANPYRNAEPMLKMNILARYLNKLQKEGYKIAIISWLSKDSNAEYDKAVTQAKLDWLDEHLASVNFDEINIVPYGTDKATFAKTDLDILFDDEIGNRNAWSGKAYGVDDIIGVLKTL